MLMINKSMKRKDAPSIFGLWIMNLSKHTDDHFQYEAILLSEEKRLSRQAWVRYEEIRDDWEESFSFLRRLNKQPAGRHAAKGSVYPTTLKITCLQGFNLLKCCLTFSIIKFPISCSQTYLSRFGWGLYVRDAIGAGQFLGLPRVHSACWQVTFVSNEHHWNIVGVFHTFDLFSEGWKRHKWHLLTFFKTESGHSEILLVL